MKKTVLRNYARLIAKTGVNVQKGQEVIIVADLDQPEFVKTVVEECYKAGAGKVTVDWSYQPLEKINVKYRSLKTLSTVEKWEEEKWKHRVEALPCMIYLLSEDPDGSAGMDQEKYAKAARKRFGIIKPYRDAMENKYQWCIAGVPGKAWAKKLFPGERPAKAVELLWEAILKTSRADGPDPIQAWKDHNADLEKRCAYLNGLHLKELVYKASNGTDLRVGLIPDALFLGGGETALGSGIFFNPNIPSEEVFVSPMAGKAEGIVYSSKPFSFRGELIENFSVRFENGKAVEVRAEKNEELLKTMISMDEGAAMLGECALVPWSGPINRCGVLFCNTLYDENAVCHLALGHGFTNCLKDYEKYTNEECRAKGINDSMIHEDFMIGTEDLSITGIAEDGKEYPIFRNGEWAF
ncbi:MAG: aminopeptidase [Lachnospiraceae bacterium]|nr:aminopeptidase [Lachnospiraceae bacterium]